MMAEAPGPVKPILCPMCRESDLIRTGDYLTTNTGTFEELRYCNGCLNAVGVRSARGDDEHYVFGRQFGPVGKAGGPRKARTKWPRKV